MSRRVDTFEFAIVGAGWRSQFFLDVAAALPQMKVSGVVSSREDRASQIESRWRVPCFPSIEAMLTKIKPSFVVACVTASAMSAVSRQLAERGVPVLAETPPATSVDDLIELWDYFETIGAPIQVAEQYWAQPLHAARQAIVEQGLLGRVNQVHLSVCHGYHAMSLIRRALGIRAEPARISGHRFRGRVVAGPDRDGPPTAETLIAAETDYAWLNFGDRMGLYEFCLPQYRSWIRDRRVCIRGERGEIVDERVTFLQDAVTPLTARLERHEAGRHGNLEGLYLKAIQHLGEWIYRNPTVPARLSDEEIAVTQCLLGMQRYVESGQPFYTLAEASQDQYLALACEEAITTGRTVVTEEQPWARQI